MLQRIRLIICMVVALLASRAAAQQVIYVNAAAAPGGDGRSWATAHNTLDAAIDEAALVPAATRNALIFVARGTYVPGGFSGGATSLRYRPESNTHIYGGFVGTETDIDERDAAANPTIITGDAVGNDAPNSTDVLERSDNRSVLFDLQSCNNLTLDGLILTRCSNNNNTPNTGGAIRMGNGGTNVVVRDCTFIQNFGGTGAAFNTANLAGQPRFENCRFIGNSSTGGGAVYIQGGSALFLSCLFQANQARGAGLGGCVGCSRGGAVTLSSGGSHEFRNCTFSQNTSPMNGAAIFAEAGSPVLRNCIVWANAPTTASVTSVPGTVTLVNTLLPSGAATGTSVINTNTLNTDPLLVDTDGPDNIPGTADDNGRIGAGSPAINSGDNLFVITGQMIEDVEGNRRVHNATVDRGAVEFEAPAYSPILYVKADATGANNGSSWADAFSGEGGVRSALALTGVDGYYRQIWVAGGVYKPIAPGNPRTESLAITFGTRVFGGFVGTETSPAQRVTGAAATTFSGDFLGNDTPGGNRADNAFHVVTFQSAAQAPLLDGVTITGGHADGVGGNGLGGGAVANFSSQPPQIRNCRFIDNFATTGGGFGLDSTVGGASLIGCTFERNSAGTGGGGGVAHLSGSSGSYVDCTFFENSSSGNGAGFACTSALAIPQFGNCTFTRNHATGPAARGGGLFAANYALVDSCRFLGNSAAQGGGIAWQLNPTSDLFLVSAVNVLFVGNIATTDGGGAFVGLGHLSGNLIEPFVSCTFVANRCLGGSSGGIRLTTNNPVFAPAASSILWGNTGLVGGVQTISEQTQLSMVGAPAPVIDCVVEGNAGINRAATLHGLNPLFLRMPSPGADLVYGTTDDDYGDLRLAPSSPAIDNGHTFGTTPSKVPLDYLDRDNDGSLREPAPFDLGGAARFVDDPSTPDAGIPSPHISLDRGCFEFQPGCPTCPGVRQWFSPVTAAVDSTYSWSISVPGPMDDTLFALNSTYSVSFGNVVGSTVTHRSAVVDRGTVTLDLAGRTMRYTLASSAALSISSENQTSLPIVNVLGGTLRAPSVRVANLPGGRGELNISGPGARLLVPDDSLSVGFLGEGSMTISGGATATTRIASVGDQPGSMGTVVVEGPGSVWTVPFFLTVNNGRVTIRDGATLNVGFGAFLLQHGVIDGNGTINGALVNFGSIEPGNSPGTLTVNGDYTQLGEIEDLGPASGLLRMQVESVTPNQFDRLIVTGQTQLGGGLIVESPVGGFPAPPPEGL
ncbi:MAG: right-handed parallel beta-helix repeat-containing protein, partial [Phycisphaerales bacterium]